VGIHIGCYVKCNFEKIKTTRKVYGCLEHGSYSNKLFLYCHYCGRKLEIFEETVDVYPDMHKVLDKYSSLGSVYAGGGLYMVSSDTSDGTNFSNQDGDIVLNTTVMGNALLEFHRLYALEIEKLRTYGPIEIHFGLLYLDEA